MPAVSTAATSRVGRRRQNLQCTKSRQAEHRWCSGLYGDLMPVNSVAGRASGVPQPRSSITRRGIEALADPEVRMANFRVDAGAPIQLSEDRQSARPGLGPAPSSLTFKPGLCLRLMSANRASSCASVRASTKLAACCPYPSAFKRFSTTSRVIIGVSTVSNSSSNVEFGHITTVAKANRAAGIATTVIAITPMAVLRRMVCLRCVNPFQLVPSYGHRRYSHASSASAIAINSDSCGEPKARSPR
jgi:hypothetical protein